MIRITVKVHESRFLEFAQALKPFIQEGIELKPVGTPIKEGPAKKPKRTKKTVEPEPEVHQSGISEEDVRKKLAGTLQNADEDVRKQCKNKLTELGAKAVSGLKPEQYREFMDFLDTL